MQCVKPQLRNNDWYLFFYYYAVSLCDILFIRNLKKRQHSSHIHTHTYKVSGKLSEQMPFRETLELRVVVGVIKNNMPTHTRPFTNGHAFRQRPEGGLCSLYCSIQ